VVQREPLILKRRVCADGRRERRGIGEEKKEEVTRKKVEVSGRKRKWKGCQRSTMSRGLKKEQSNQK
jgi:hypothetical protein